MDAKEIINKWCAEAHIRNLLEHKKYFWIIRDILEGHICVPEVVYQEAVEWVEEHVKESEDKDVLLDDVRRMVNA